MATPASRNVPRGARVLALRQMEGLTQAELAGQLNVTQGFISHVEKDLKPLPQELAALAADKFDLPIQFFSAPRDLTDEGVVTFRKSSKASARDEAKVTSTFGDAARLFRMASEGSGYQVADLEALRDYDENITADNVRGQLRLGPDDPLLNATRAAERLGVGVIHDLVELSADLADHAGVSRPNPFVNRPLIATIGSQPPAVLRMTVMHELGHLIYDRDRTTPIRGTRTVEERRAFRFAGAMLIPAHVVTQRITETLTLQGYLRIKADYGVSVAALIVRAADLGAISAQRKRSLFIQLSSQGWRRDEPVAVAAETPLLMGQAAKRGISNSTREIAETVGIRYNDATQWTGLTDDLEQHVPSNVIPLRPAGPRATPAPQ